MDSKRESLMPVVAWAEVKAEAESVRASLLSFSSLSVLGNLIAHAFASSLSSNTYEFPNVEYAALVIWHEPHDLADAVPVAGEQVERLSGALNHLFFTLGRYYAGEEELAKEKPDQADMSHRLRLAGLGIRVPAYEVHQRRVLRGLFQPFSSELRTAIGFDVEDVLAAFESINELAEAALLQLRKEAVHLTSQSAVDGHFARFGDRLSFDADVLAATAGVTFEIAQKILTAFSLGRGEPNEHALIPSPFSVLRERPILRTEADRFIVPNHALLLPSVQARIEAMLNTAINPLAAAGLWNRYQDHRGSWVELEADRLIRSMIPGGDGIIGGYYHIDVDDPIEGKVRRQVESDVTYKVDDALFLVEGKAGSFAPATFRGGAGSLSRDVKDIITKGHEQCARSETYVRAGHRSLENSDGTTAFTIGDPIREIFKIVVTLDNAGVLATATALMQRAGYMPGEPTWVLSLTDLMILSETLRRPGEFRHYARRRYESILTEHVLIFDETDPLGIYLRHNDTTLMLGEADTVMLSDYNESLDAHYVRQEGVLPPCLELPVEAVELVEALARFGAVHWSQAVCDLLALGTTLKTVAEHIAERRETSRPRDFTIGLEGGTVLTILIMPGADPRRLIKAFLAGVVASPIRPLGKRLFVAYDPAAGIAVAEYRQLVDQAYVIVPPSLTWSSTLTPR